MLDVFRFSWCAVRTFASVILLILALYTALWGFVKLHSAAARNVDPDAALQRVSRTTKGRSWSARRQDGLQRSARGCLRAHYHSPYDNNTLLDTPVSRSRHWMN